MSHIYKASEWQNGDSGPWYVNDVSELSTTASKWYVPVRILGITPVEYVLLLRDKFNAKRIRYHEPTDVLLFSFDTQADARVYKNWINKKARQSNFMVGKISST